MASDVQKFAVGMDTLLRNQPLQEKLRELVRQTAISANATAASLYLLDDSGKVLKPAVLYGLPDEYVRGCGDVAVGDQCCGRAVEARRPWIVTDMLTDPLFANGRQAAEASPIRAAFSIPVITTDGRVLGSLACHYPNIYTPTNYDIERNQLWATIIAFAISAMSTNGSTASA